MLVPIRKDTNELTNIPVFQRYVDQLGDWNVHVDYTLTNGDSSTCINNLAEMLSRPDTLKGSYYSLSDIFFPQHRMTYIQHIYDALPDENTCT